MHCYASNFEVEGANWFGPVRLSTHLPLPHPAPSPSPRPQPPRPHRFFLDLDSLWKKFTYSSPPPPSPPPPPAKKIKFGLTRPSPLRQKKPFFLFSFKSGFIVNRPHQMPQISFFKIWILCKIFTNSSPLPTPHPKKKIKFGFRVKKH